MSTSSPTAVLEDLRMPVQARLGAAWTSFMFLYVYVDVLGLNAPGYKAPPELDPAEAEAAAAAARAMAGGFAAGDRRSEISGLIGSAIGDVVRKDKKRKVVRICHFARTVVNASRGGERSECRGHGVGAGGQAVDGGRCAAVGSSKRVAPVAPARRWPDAARGAGQPAPPQAGLEGAAGVAERRVRHTQPRRRARGRAGRASRGAGLPTRRCCQARARP